MRSIGGSEKGARGGNRVSPARPSRRRGRWYDGAARAGGARGALRPRRRRTWADARGRGRRDRGPDRPQRRRQVDDVARDRRPRAHGGRRGAARRPLSQRRAAGGDRPGGDLARAGGQAHLRGLQRRGEPPARPGCQARQRCRGGARGRLRALPDARRDAPPPRGCALGRTAAAARDRPCAGRGPRPAPARRALARARAEPRRARLRRPGLDSRARGHRPARGAARAAHGRVRRPHLRARQRRAADDPHPGRRRRHGSHDRGVPEVSLLAAVDAQTLVDAVGLGAVYALMAVGIGLVFGVLRLVNFAYGQLVMAGAYTLAFTSSWPAAASVAACVLVVLALSTAMDLAVFRPLRGQSPAVMLVTTFALAFLLQSIALILDLRDDTI